jgi:spermidine/putrescine transport system ATP-binding protein
MPEAGARPMIELDHVSRRFEADRAAVDDVALAIAPGEFFSLLGPSGCGKTTTLRMIAGFEEPDSGRVLIEGEDVTFVSPRRRAVHMVFQDYALFPHMSVAENVAFGLKIKKTSRDETVARVRETLESMQLAELAGRRPAQLSGGQRQRVALSRALVNRPAALLLDEPLGALDLKLRKEMQLELKQIQQRTETTFVYVTHDQEEALTMSDRIAVMNKGRIEQVADPEQVYDKPASSFVAGFIGVSNLMPGKVAKAGKSGEVELDSGVKAPADAEGFKAGDRCHAVVRPEKLEIGPGGRGDPSVEGVVESSLYLGTATQMIVQLPGEVRMTVLVPNADEAERQKLPGGGAKVKLSWATEHMHLVRESPDQAASSRDKEEQT